MQITLARIMKSTGSHYKILLPDHSEHEAVLSGKIRLENRKTTNPVCVGDWVDVEWSENVYVIRRIHPRKNYIIRQSNNLSKLTHTIAANLDQAFLMVTFSVPFTPQGFIDRFLVTCEAYRIPAFLVVNKSDLHDEAIQEYAQHMKKIYENAGYPVFFISCAKKYGIDDLIKHLEGKTTLISGNSGTGKSSLIKILIPELNIKIAPVSHKHLKGKHTTTFAEMYRLNNNSFIIDTPGIRDLGLVEMKPDEVGHYFPEIRKYMNDCKFNNCTHDHEPECAVREAVESGFISKERYSGYLQIIHGDEMEWEAWKLK
ncbi:MAG: ribosome small subunit-dependent GTPase A [Bacteroidia bacterium]|nr:ribosome small subunit-dependent GTPase A [Bacteroidia bacterium]